MALLDTIPVLVRDKTYRFSPLYSWSTGALLQYWIRQERVYEWLCDSSGGETTHEGTYATGAFVLEESGTDIPRGGDGTGVWSEIYRTPGTLVTV
jgi:hypothetical protein